MFLHIKNGRNWFNLVRASRRQSAVCITFNERSVKYSRFLSLHDRNGNDIASYGICSDSISKILTSLPLFDLSCSVVKKKSNTFRSNQTFICERLCYWSFVTLPCSGKGLNYGLNDCLYDTPHVFLGRSQNLYLLLNVAVLIRNIRVLRRRYQSRLLL